MGKILCNRTLPMCCYGNFQRPSRVIWSPSYLGTMTRSSGRDSRVWDPSLSNSQQWNEKSGAGYGIFLQWSLNHCIYTHTSCSHLRISSLKGNLSMFDFRGAVSKTSMNGVVTSFLRNPGSDIEALACQPKAYWRFQARTSWAATEKNCVYLCQKGNVKAVNWRLYDLGAGLELENAYGHTGSLNLRCWMNATHAATGGGSGLGQGESSEFSECKLRVDNELCPQCWASWSSSCVSRVGHISFLLFDSYQ